MAGYPDYYQRTIAAHACGVKLVLGTDAGTPYNRHGDNARELSLMVKLGASPLDALYAGTRNGADLLGRLDDLGTIKPGKLADLVLVQGEDAPAGRDALRQQAGVTARAGGGVHEGLPWLGRQQVEHFGRQHRLVPRLRVRSSPLRTNNPKSYSVAALRRSSKVLLVPVKTGLAYQGWARPIGEIAAASSWTKLRRSDDDPMKMSGLAADTALHPNHDCMIREYTAARCDQLRHRMPVGSAESL